MPPNTVYVGRGSRWGNPFVVAPKSIYAGLGYMAGIARDRFQACHNYGYWLMGKLRDEPDFLTPLRGKNLACWCPLDQPCHADTLLHEANK